MKSKQTTKRKTKVSNPLQENNIQATPNNNIQRTQHAINLTRLRSLV